MGFALGIGSAFFFAATSVLVRIGQRRPRADDGVLMSVFVNVVILGLAASFAPKPPWDTAGVVALVLGGIVGSVGGRSLNLRAVRLIGPSRASAFITGTPLAAAIIGWFVLDERLTPVEAFGGMLVIAGLLWLVRVRAGARGTTVDERVPLSSYLVAAAAPLFFGTAFVIRKWGLQQFDSSVIGAFLGSSAAFVVLTSVDVARGRVSERVERNVRPITWWYVAAGVTASLALLSQYTTFGYLPAWVVGILQATQGLWAILLGVLFLKGDERVDATLIGSILLVVSGVALIAVQ